MDKRWLSELLNDAAFPSLALAVAVSQIKVEANKNSDVSHYEARSVEVQLDGRFQQDAGRHEVSTLGRSRTGAERPVSNQDAVRKD
jgi:hypothetical protein